MGMRPPPDGGSVASGGAALERQVAPAHDALDEHVAGLQRLDEVGVDRLRLAGVVRRVVADVHIERRAVALGPSVDGQVRFGEDDRDRGAAFLRAVNTVELVEMIAQDREARVLARVHAQRAELLGRDEQLALLAVVEIGNDVQSLHFDTPFQAKVHRGGTHRATSGVPLRRDALRPRAADEVLLAEVYPSEKYQKYRREKVRKYNRIKLRQVQHFQAFSPRFRLTFATPPCPTRPPPPLRAPTSSTPSARSPWTRCRRPTPAIPACPWAWRRSPRCCGGGSCATTRRIPPGPTATGSSCRTGTARCSSTRCCISPATTCRWKSCAAAASCTRARPAIRRSAARPASRRRRARWGRGSRMPSDSRSPSACSPRSSTVRVIRSWTISPMSSWAMGASWRASRTKLPRSRVCSGWASSSRSMTTTASASTARWRDGSATTRPSVSKPMAGT